MTSRIYGSSGGKTNPMTAVAILVGVAGAACSAILWLHRVSPSSPFLKSVTSNFTSNAVFGDRLEVIALVGGAIAILVGLLSVIGGGRAGAGVAVAVVFGLVAISYPVLSSLNLLGKAIHLPVK